MTVFNEYARYYDLLYRDKNYKDEVEYIHRLIQDNVPGAHTILNLGCGSGRHDRYLADLGYMVTGVDFSEEMLSSARNAAKGSAQLDYVSGDVCKVRLGKRYDVVVSLFHVMSYQVTNADLKAAFATACAHMNPEGLFIFDCWYGPGVLSDRPAVRLKELEDDIITVTRIAEPVMHPDKDVVDVNYRVFIKDKVSGNIHDLRETHRMRYMFIPEINEYLACSGLQPVFYCRWMENNAPDDATWYLCCGAKHKATGEVEC